MGKPFNILVASDLHYAGALERQRHNFESAVIRHPAKRMLAKAYRHFIWLADPLAHHHLLDRLLEHPGTPDLTVLNGDYSCDSGFIGVADDAAFASAKECLDRLRARFHPNLAATIGDHELGKFTLLGGVGGLRLKSYWRAVQDLKLKPFWKLEAGRHALIGITSSLAALPVFENETLPEELQEWNELRRDHLEMVDAAFNGLAPNQRVLLFCHDPSALPFLAERPPIRQRLEQIELTIIGHLHTQWVLRASRLLCGMPTLHCLGNTVRRYSSALEKARAWKLFKVILCPSLTGIQLCKDGGYLTLELDGEGKQAVRVVFHPLLW